MNYSERFPLLHGFFFNVFNVDWQEDHESEDDAIKEDVYDTDAQCTLDTIKELDDLIALKLSEPELRSVIVSQFGSGYYPGYTLHTVEEVYDWLRFIRNTMAKYATEKAKQEEVASAKSRQ